MVNILLKDHKTQFYEFYQFSRETYFSLVCVAFWGAFGQCWRQFSSMVWIDSWDKSLGSPIIRHWQHPPSSVALCWRILKRNQLQQTRTRQCVKMIITLSERFNGDKAGGDVSISEVGRHHEENHQEGIRRRPARQLEVGECGELVVLGGHHVGGHRAR